MTHWFASHDGPGPVLKEGLIGSLHRARCTLTDATRNDSLRENVKWTGWDLNPGLPACKAGDLPLIYRPARSGGNQSALSDFGPEIGRQIRLLHRSPMSVMNG
jgi:hypothetical protein